MRIILIKIHTVNPAPQMQSLILRQSYVQRTVVIFRGKCQLEAFRQETALFNLRSQHLYCSRRNALHTLHHVGCTKRAVNRSIIARRDTSRNCFVDQMRRFFLRNRKPCVTALFQQTGISLQRIVKHHTHILCFKAEQLPFLQAEPISKKMLISASRIAFEPCHAAFQRLFI